MKTAACVLGAAGLVLALASCVSTPAERPTGAPKTANESATGAPAAQPAIAVAPQAPSARPQVVKRQQVRPAVLPENRSRARSVGNVAVDAKWSNYGAYLQRMIEAVQAEWDRLLSDRKSYPGSGTTVSVRFVLDAEGKVARVVDVDNRSSEDGAKLCLSAITGRAPYGRWTDDMKAALGEAQEMTFTFYYH